MELQNLETMTALFGKLKEHKLEIGRLNDEEDQGNKMNIAFKSKIFNGKNQ